MNTKFTEKQLVKHVANETGVRIADAKKVVNETFKQIGDMMTKGDKITIIGFGAFERRKRKGRISFDMRAGSPVEVKAYHSPFFKPSVALKNAVKEAGD